MLVTSELMQPKKQRAVIFDRNSLSFEYNHALLAAFGLADLSQNKLKVL